MEIVNELAKFGIFRADIEGTLWWLQILESINVPTELTKVARRFKKLSRFDSGRRVVQKRGNMAIMLISSATALRHLFPIQIQISENWG